MGGFLGGYIVYIETAKRRRSVKFCVCVCVCTRRKTAGIYDIRGKDAICNTGSIMSQSHLEASTKLYKSEPILSSETGVTTSFLVEEKKIESRLLELILGRDP